MEILFSFFSLWLPICLALICLAAGTFIAAKLIPSSSKGSFLDRSRQVVTLTSKWEISHDSYLLRFEFDDPGTPLGLPVGKHIKIFAANASGITPGKWNNKDDGEADVKEVERKYTPVSASSARGFFELAIKVYEKNSLLGFPDGGKMSQHLGKLKIGETIEIQGPFGIIEYGGKGSFTFLQRTKNFKHLGLLAGGTGITPMLQLIKAVAADDSDRTKVHLLYANKSPEDILFSDDIEELAQQHPDRFRIWYTVDKAPPGWKYSKGFIDEKMISDRLPCPSEDTAIFCCGPQAMVKFACKENLRKLGYNMNHVFEF